MSTFKITRERTVPVTTYRREVEVVRETDDWIEAEDTYREAVFSRRAEHRRDQVKMAGTHPTHSIVEGHCEACGAPDNGCYKIHAPCGYDFGGRAFLTVLEDEKAARAC